MANIQQIAEELCRLTTKEVNELSQVMKSEYGIEPAACIDRDIEERLRRYEEDRRRLLELSKEALVDLIIYRPTMF